MIKASALQAVHCTAIKNKVQDIRMATEAQVERTMELHLLEGTENAACVSTIKNDPRNLIGLIRYPQNMQIESVLGEDAIPDSVASLSARLLAHNELMKDILSVFRQLYVKDKDTFRIQLEDKTPEERQIIIGLLQDMCGAIAGLHYNEWTATISGRLASAPKARDFITGQYLEIAIYEPVCKIVEYLAGKYGKEYNIYRNVHVATRQGLNKNEFDIVIRFDGTFYVIEIKSGKNFDDFDRYRTLGQEYDIVPRRFLLIDNYLTDDEASMAEYFNDYYVTNLCGNSLEDKLSAMIENDVIGGAA